MSRVDVHVHVTSGSQLHPDRRENEAANGRSGPSFADVSKAYAILADPHARRGHDAAVLRESTCQEQS